MHNINARYIVYYSCTVNKSVKFGNSVRLSTCPCPRQLSFSAIVKHSIRKTRFFCAIPLITYSRVSLNSRLLLWYVYSKKENDCMWSWKEYVYSGLDSSSHSLCFSEGQQVFKVSHKNTRLTNFFPMTSFADSETTRNILSSDIF